MTIETDDPQDFLNWVLKSEKMQFFKVSLSFIDEPGLNVDEIVIVQFIHPRQQIEDNLRMILYLFKL